MNEVLKRLGEIGVIPVVKIEKASDALNLGKALAAGGLPVAEITFRTDAAEESIRIIAKQLPEVLVGAGTVLSVEQAKKAVAAGAKYIVAPGFNPKVVDYCIGAGVPITPGVSGPTEIEMALDKGLEVLKLFPAGALGGLDYIKAISAPYGGVKFIPTGGIEPGNLKEYLSFPKVHAVGGTWVAKDAVISAGKFDEITKLSKEAVAIANAFELAHLGINEADAGKAMAQAELMAKLFGMAVKDGNSSTFAGTGFEIMKSPYLGKYGHIALAVPNIARAIAFLKGKGIGIKADTAKEKNGQMIAVYLDMELSGFAIHLLQK